jgi:multicomponent Na+:H+ antiporter subunit E
MIYLLLNVVLALAWSALNEEFSQEVLIIGFILGYLILWGFQPVLGSRNYVRKIPFAIYFVFYFFWQVIQANLRVAWEVLTPGFGMRPAIVAIPLDVKTPLEITLLAQCITLTPGTLSIDVSSDRSVLYIHAMYVNDLDEYRQIIKDGFERRILELFR